MSQCRITYGLSSLGGYTFKWGEVRNNKKIIKLEHDYGNERGM